MIHKTRDISVLYLNVIEGSPLSGSDVDGYVTITNVIDCIYGISIFDDNLLKMRGYSSIRLPSQAMIHPQKYFTQNVVYKIDCDFI